MVTLLISIQYSVCQEVIAQPFDSQSPFNLVNIDETTPDWARMMYADNPNIRSVIDLHDKWRIDNPEVKTAHTRNLKHFMKYLVVRDAINAEGFIDIPEDVGNRDLKWLKKRTEILESGLRRNQNTWTPLGPNLVPETQNRVNAQANIYSIDQSKSNPDILFCGTETSCVFKSTDRGESWSSMCENNVFGGPMEIEIHPTEPNIVYLGTNHDIMKTIDGGVTWNSVRYNWSQNISTIIINPDDPEIILAGGNEGLYKSGNGGTTWTQITSRRVYDLKFKTDDPDVIFSLQANTNDNVTDFYRSSDTGSTWTKITDGWSEPDASTQNIGGRMTVSDEYGDVIYTFTGAKYSTLADPKDGIKIRKSSDGGVSWKLLVDSEQDFYRPNGSGTSRINNGQGYYDWDIEMMDADTNTVMLGTQGKWLTNNGFSNDTLVDWGSAVGGHSDMQEVLFNGDDLWVATDGGIVKSNPNLLGYDIKMNGINCAEFWSFDQGWNRDAQVGTLYHNGTIGRTDSYDDGVFRFFGGAEPSFSMIKAPYPDKIVSKGYGSVNGRSLPDNFDDGEVSFSYNLTPNSYYALWLTNEESEAKTSPYNYNVHWAGMDNGLFKSIDFGLSWRQAYEGRTDGKITKIQLPKANGDVLYVSEFHPSGYAIYKSIDGGESFFELDNLPTNNEDDGIFLSCDHTDENIIFIAFGSSSSSNDKVWMSDDGGSSWENINATSNIFDGLRIRDIQMISGTDGGLYAITDHGVFYRNNTTDWAACINGLPANLRIRHIKPYYKEGKIRIATMNRGVYTADFEDQPTEVEVQPTVNVTEGQCERDTFYFEDYSILNHTGATWSWSFEPAPVFVDDTNIRNPKVLFGANGAYQASLTITKGGQSYTDTLDKRIIINSLCNPDDHPGTSYKMEEYGDHAQADDPGLNLSEWTVSFWIKPDEDQTSTSTIFDAINADDNRDFCVNFYGATANPTIHYKGAGGWAWGTNPNIPVTYNQWNHIAVTSSVTTNEVSIYVNGRKFTYPNVSAQEISFHKMIIGWQYKWWSNRYYTGEIDELAIYERALDQDEVRLRMHITKDLSTDPDLIHYYQWNEGIGNRANDKVGISHLSHPKDQVISSGPFSDGTSSKLQIETGGIKDFSNEGVIMDFPSSGTYPNGEVVVTRLQHSPDTNPTNNEAGESYWVIHNYGTNPTFSPLESIEFEGYGPLSDTETENLDFLNLYNRSFGNHGATWAGAISHATSADPDPINKITFAPPQITSFGQFVIAKSDCKNAIPVFTSSDDGDGSLRNTILNACPGDTIRFDFSIIGEPIILSSGEIDLDKDLYILGTGLGDIIVNADNTSRIFKIVDPKTVVGIENLVMENGNANTSGGTISNKGHLLLKEVIIQGSAPDAIDNQGTIKMEQSVEIKN